MTQRGRWTILGGLLIGVSMLLLFDRDEPPISAIVDAVPARNSGQMPAPVKSSASPRDSVEATVILAIRPRDSGLDVENAFAVRDWRPPPKPKPSPPARPVAPPFPYNAFGKQFENGTWRVFLRRDELIVVVGSQDTIDNVYRVEEIRPPLMTLTYLPLQERQSIQIGGAE